MESMADYWVAPVWFSVFWQPIQDYILLIKKLIEYLLINE